MRKLNSIYLKINEYLKSNLIIIILFIVFIRYDTVWSNINQVILLLPMVFVTEYREEGLGVFASSVLSILTIILAWVAYIASKKANEISKIALESERPVLTCDFVIESHSTNGKTNYLQLQNESKIEAIDIDIYFKKYGEKLTKIKDKLNLSKGIKIKVELFKGNGRGSYLVFYSNPLTGKIYAQAYNVDSGEQENQQLNEDENTLRYSSFLEIYRNLNTNKYSKDDLIRLV